jgi:hypothetical protein
MGTGRTGHGMGRLGPGEGHDTGRLGTSMGTGWARSDCVRTSRVPTSADKLMSPTLNHK